MKAYQIMMFLLVFNVAVSLVSALNIYDLGVVTSTDYDVTQQDAPTEGTNWGLYFFLGSTIALIVAGAIAGAMLATWTAKIPSDAGAAYGIFSGLFVSMTINAGSVFYRFAYMPGAESASWIITGLVSLFMAITGVVFIVGILQMIRGGWKSYA